MKLEGANMETNRYIMSRLNTQNGRHRHESSVVRGQIWVIRNDKALQLKSWSAWTRWCIAEWCWMPAEGRNIMVGFDIVLISASFAIDSPSHQSHPSRLIPDKGFRHDYLLLCHRAGAQGGGAEWCSTFVWQRLPAVVFFKHQATPFEPRLACPRHGVNKRMHRSGTWQPVGHTKTRRPRSKCPTMSN